MGRLQNQNVSSSDRRPQDNKITLPRSLSIVLYQPRIPQNTGSIARMCAATGSKLDLINPLFKLDEKKLIRAGLDYWPLLDVFLFDSWDDWLQQRKTIPWMAEVNAPQSYTSVPYQPNDYIMFGDEQEGVPQALLEKYTEKHIGIPQQGVRSLNLATSVGIVSYEAYRQLDWLHIPVPKI